MKKKVSLSTLHPSANIAFKSLYYVEDAFSDATIKVDYDTDRNPFNLEKVSKFIKSYFEKSQLKIKCLGVFSTGKGHHLRIWLKYEYPFGYKIPASKILEIQEKLGDDPKRIKFNKARVRRGEPYWNVLWRAKWRNGKVISKEEFLVDITNQLLENINAGTKLIHTSIFYIHQK